MELFPKDYVTELTTKKLGNSLGFLTITHMTLSAKQFRCYGIFTIDIAAGFCFLTEEQLNGSSVSILGLTGSPEYYFGRQLSQLSDDP
jgi:hypothetical protein